MHTLFLTVKLLHARHDELHRQIEARKTEAAKLFGEYERAAEQEDKVVAERARQALEESARNIDAGNGGS